MELDCHEPKMEISSDPAPPDPLKHLFESLSAHITSQTVKIQDQIQQNDLRLTSIQDNFMAEVRGELDTFQELLASQHTNSSVTQSVPSATPPSLSTSHVMVPPVQVRIPTLMVSPSNSDLQSQMMLLLTDSFSKLSTALMDQKGDSFGLGI